MVNESASPGRDLRIGTVLDRRYRIDRLLGVGGTGAVYEAWHLHLERPVAIKVLHPQFANRPDHIERFRLEAQVMGMVGHDNAVTVLDFRYAAGRMPYIVMELVQGETLRARLARGPLQVSEVAALFPPLCEALQQAHERGIIHCDLKPDNLMLQQREEGVLMKILDFGTSRLTSRGTASGLDEAGTPHYVAPERLQEGAAAADHRVDIFSLGAILYECLTGEMAFGGETPIVAIYRVLHEPVPPLRLPDGRAAPSLDAVVQRACHKDPQRRYGTVRDLAAALVDAAAQTGRMISGTFTAAIARQHITSQPPPVQRQPMVPCLLSDSPPTGAGIKPAVLGAVVQQIAGAVGMEPILQRLGAEWLGRLQKLVMTDWVDGVELFRLLELAEDCLGEQAKRNMGRVFADVALTTVYKALLVVGEPEYVVRRTQVMLRLWHSEGESVSKELAPGRWLLRIGRCRTMNLRVAENTAGFIERYLELAGATDVAVDCARRDEEAGVVWEFDVSFTPVAPPPA